MTGEATTSETSVTEEATTNEALSDFEVEAGLSSFEEFLEKVSVSHPNYYVNVPIMHQQIKMMKDSLLPSNESSVQQNSSFGSTTSISDILKVPAQPQRSGVHRNYKKKNYGGMNSREMMEKYDQEIEVKDKAEVEKAERKSQREEKKLINETIKNIWRRRKPKKHESLVNEKLRSNKQTKLSSRSAEDHRKQSHPQNKMFKFEQLIHFLHVKSQSNKVSLMKYNQ